MMNPHNDDNINLEYLCDRVYTMQIFLFAVEALKQHCSEESAVKLGIQCLVLYRLQTLFLIYILLLFEFDKELNFFHTTSIRCIKVHLKYP